MFFFATLSKGYISDLQRGDKKKNTFEKLRGVSDNRLRHFWVMWGAVWLVSVIFLLMSGCVYQNCAQRSPGNGWFFVGNQWILSSPNFQETYSWHVLFFQHVFNVAQSFSIGVCHLLNPVRFKPARMQSFGVMPWVCWMICTSRSGREGPRGFVAGRFSQKCGDVSWWRFLHAFYDTVWN